MVVVAPRVAVVGCVTDSERVAAAMRVHAARARFGRRLGAPLGQIGLLVHSAVDVPPIRALGAMASALGTGPVARSGLRAVAPVVAMLLELALVGGGAPLIFAAIGFLVWQLQQGAAFGGNGAWWSRGSRGGREADAQQVHAMQQQEIERQRQHLQAMELRQQQQLQRLGAGGTSYDRLAAAGMPMPH